MTAMTQYLAEARMMELRESRSGGRRMPVGSLIVEASQVLRGALMPVSGSGHGLGLDLQKDLGLR